MNSNLFLLKKIPQPDLGKRAFCSVFLSCRARTIRLSISLDHGLRLIIPHRLRNNDQIITEVLEKRNGWIKKHWQKMDLRQKHRLKMPKELKLKEDKIIDYARDKIIDRVQELSQGLKINFNQITVRRQKRSWGSCSQKQNLSFNWRLILLPPKLFDYVIFHELAHLSEMNHSKKFWRHLEELCAGSKMLNRELKKYQY